MSRYYPLLAIVVVVGLKSGCAPMRSSVVSNPVFVRAPDGEVAWERTVDVLHAYQFPIARESRLDGVIETDYKVGSGLAEPWHRDSSGFNERLESSLQSIRRRVVVNVIPAEGGHLIEVEAFKEREDSPVPDIYSGGAASFQARAPISRSPGRVVGASEPGAWVPLGRDAQLEQALLRSLSSSFGF